MSALKQIARSLRRNAIEGFHFRRQAPLTDFVVDFACFEARLIVEVDGVTHSTKEEIARDVCRDAVLRGANFELPRVPNDDVFNNLEGVLETIPLRLLALRPKAAS
jgi:very-short-patch-repair endonuclease